MFENIPDDTYLSEINIAGVHDACSRYVAFPYFSKCQNKSISEMLEMGIRFFDLRIELKNNRINLCHSVVTCRKSFHGKPLYFDDLFKIFRQFLEANPEETLILSIKRDNGPGEEETFRFFYDKFILPQKEIWYLKNEIPTLGEVRGKAVLFNRNNCCLPDNEAGLRFGRWNCMSVNGTKNPPVQSLNQRGDKYIIQDLYTLHPAEKWPAVKNTLDSAESTPEKCIVINFFSGNDVIRCPAMYAKNIYKKFSGYPIEKGRKYGWILLDFPNEKIIGKIMNHDLQSHC